MQEEDFEEQQQQQQIQNLNLIEKTVKIEKPILLQMKKKIQPKPKPLIPSNDLFDDKKKEKPNDHQNFLDQIYNKAIVQHQQNAPLQTKVSLLSQPSKILPLQASLIQENKKRKTDDHNLNNHNQKKQKFPELSIHFDFLHLHMMMTMMMMKKINL